MKPYADTNFLTRCFLAVDGFAPPGGTLEPLAAGGGWLPVTWLHRLEVSNAFEQHVFASRTLGQVRVTPEMAAAAQERFRGACSEAASPFREAAVAIPELEGRFTEISRRHTAKHGFRTYDILHVSSALVLGCDRVWSFDSKVNKLARVEGLGTLGE